MNLILQPDAKASEQVSSTGQISTLEQKTQVPKAANVMCFKESIYSLFFFFFALFW